VKGAKTISERPADSGITRIGSDESFLDRGVPVHVDFSWRHDDRFRRRWCELAALGFGCLGAEDSEPTADTPGTKGLNGHR
jgi:hypothetical protein